MVGLFAVDSHSSEESPNMFIEANEKADGGTVYGTKLSARTVQAIPGLLIGY